MLSLIAYATLASSHDVRSHTMQRPQSSGPGVLIIDLPWRSRSLLLSPCSVSASIDSRPECSHSAITLSRPPDYRACLMASPTLHWCHSRSKTLTDHSRPVTTCLSSHSVNNTPSTLIPFLHLSLSTLLTFGKSSMLALAHLPPSDPLTCKRPETVHSLNARNVWVTSKPQSGTLTKEIVARIIGFQHTQLVAPTCEKTLTSVPYEKIARSSKQRDLRPTVHEPPT